MDVAGQKTRKLPAKRDLNEVIPRSKIFGTKKNRKKGVYIPMKRSRDSYAAGETPAVVKEYRAQLAAAFKRRGVSLWATNFVPEREGDRRGESCSVS
jgi:hypothetical protein